MASEPVSERVKAHLPLSARDFHMLFVLTDGACHGYGMVKAIEEQTDGVVRIDPANLYRALQKMVDGGLVEEAEDVREPRHDRRRYYRLTELGRAVVRAEARRMRELAAAAEAKDLIPESRTP